MAGSGDNLSTFGRYFFTAAYLMVDHDSHTFTMWQANPSTKTNLIPVVRKTTANKACESGEGGSNGDNSTGSGSPGEGSGGGGAAVDSSSPPTISIGVIAGAAAGGTAVIAALAVLVFLLLRRRKKNKALSGPRSEKHSETQARGKEEIDYKPDNSVPQEVSGHAISPRELQGVSTSSHGNARWSNKGSWTTSGTPRGSGFRYELDGGAMPHDYRT